MEIVCEKRLAHGVVSYFNKKAAQRKHICMILKATQWSSSDHLYQNPTFPCNSVTLGKTLKLSPSFIQIRRVTITILLHQEAGLIFDETHSRSSLNLY